MSTAWAQSVELTGVVRDKVTGQVLPLAHIIVFPDSLKSAAGNSGVFTISVRPGNKIINVSYVGYKTAEYKLRLVGDKSIELSLEPTANKLDEVVVTSGRFANIDAVQSTRFSTNTLSREEINNIPVLGGEGDVIKALQLMPGTVRGVEGSSDLFVRGGAADQNLVSLDGATVYNTSHLFGFLSVFNPDVVSGVESINGAFPAQYGGRLSSILKVNTRNSIPDRTHASADIGLIAARMFIEQPLVRNKASIWLAGRRTYIDQVARAAKLDLPYFFYDFNGKILLHPTKRDNIQIGHYTGDDKLEYLLDRNGDGIGQTTGYRSGNISQNIHWDHRSHGNWSHDLTVYRTQYRYNIHSQFGNSSILALSNIHDVGGKILVNNDSLLHRGSLQFGADGAYHTLTPNVVNTSGTISDLLKGGSSTGKVAIEMAAFIQYEIELFKKIRISSGIRGSAGVVAHKTYVNPEPRVALRYMVNEHSSLKISYSRMAQYLHRVSSSAVSSPTDIWYPVTDSIKPQTSDQFGIAYQKIFPTPNVLLSVETYYKKMHQLVGYEEGTNLIFNTDFESSLIQGDGKAYGFEFLLRKQFGKFTGWVDYTLSWSWRRYSSINNGEWFHARYDRRHNGAIVLQYAFAKRWSASVVWEYISGSRFTPVIGQYVTKSPSLTGIDLIPVYAPINSVRLSDTHRLDVGIKFRSKEGRHLQWQIYAGVYNAYNRANPVGLFVAVDKDTGTLKYQQPGLFGLLPFVNYEIRF
ncbi:MAG TPA: carboxypeptidase-like regulatory domain-containing protein [Cyclobacteriaceae bacterium]